MSEVVNYERAWLHLRAHIRSKRHHGGRELLEVMSDLEMESFYGPEDRPKILDSHPLSKESGGDAPSEETAESKPMTDVEGDASWTQIAPTPSSPSPTETSSPPQRAMATQ